jgi:hypothetical protein
MRAGVISEPIGLAGVGESKMSQSAFRFGQFFTSEMAFRFLFHSIFIGVAFRFGLACTIPIRYGVAFWSNDRISEIENCLNRMPLSWPGGQQFVSTRSTFLQRQVVL